MRSYKFGDLRKQLQESTNEFKPKFGDGVESQNKKINDKAYSDIKKETKAYNGGLSQSKTVKHGSSIMSDVNKGLSDLQYDGEVSDDFKERAKAGYEGYTSALEKKNHGKEVHGNATFDDAIAKEVERKATDLKKMQDAQSEVGITNAQKPKEKTHLHDDVVGESKKISLLKFKRVQFISESHMLSHVPDEYKVEGKKFYMQDCYGDKYLVEWHKQPDVEKQLNESKVNSEMDRIKYLFDYKGQKSKTTNALRMNEDKNIGDMLGRVRKLME
jgi:hypothetical protein